MGNKERKDSEALLDESEALLRRAQHVAKLGHWISTVTTGPDGSATVVTRYGAAAAEILGRPIEELEVSDEEFIRRFVHPDDRATTLEINGQYIRDLIDLPPSGAKPTY